MSGSISRFQERLYDGHVFDLDGTIYLGEEPLPGAGRLVLKLRDHRASEGPG